IGTRSSCFSVANARSVAATTAYVSLPTRNARISGCLRIFAMIVSLPAINPPCVAPISLSVEQVTTSTPLAISSRIVAPDAKPYFARSTTRPLPSSYSSGIFFDRASATSSAIGGVSVKPTMSKFERWTRRIAAVEIELEVRVAGHNLRGFGPDHVVNRSASEVRVDDDAGSVDHAA